MGTSGLVGQFATIETMGVSSMPKVLILHFVLPIVLSFFISEYMRKKGWVKFGGMKI